MDVKLPTTHIPGNHCEVYVVERQLPSPPTITVLQRKKGGDGQPIQNAVSVYSHFRIFKYIHVHLKSVSFWLLLTFYFLGPGFSSHKYERQRAGQGQLIR